MPTRPSGKAGRSATAPFVSSGPATACDKALSYHVKTFAIRQIGMQMMMENSESPAYGRFGARLYDAFGASKEKDARKVSDFTMWKIKPSDLTTRFDLGDKCPDGLRKIAAKIVFQSVAADCAARSSFRFITETNAAITDANERKAIHGSEEYSSFMSMATDLLFSLHPDIAGGVRGLEAAARDRLFDEAGTLTTDKSREIQQQRRDGLALGAKHWSSANACLLQLQQDLQA